MRGPEKDDGVAGPAASRAEWKIGQDADPPASFRTRNRRKQQTIGTVGLPASSEHGLEDASGLSPAPDHQVMVHAKIIAGIESERDHQ